MKYLLLIFLLSGCSKAESPSLLMHHEAPTESVKIPPIQVPMPEVRSPARPMPSPTPAPEYDCSTSQTTVFLKSGDLDLPAWGKFVLESHLVTTMDFESWIWPKSTHDGIKEHMAWSCVLMEDRIPDFHDCDKLYAQVGASMWTPPEGGGIIGQGSSPSRPTPEEEMWSGNMNWASGKKPEPGTRFLFSANGKNVVVVMGYETGPKGTKWIGGIQPEVHFYLGTNNESRIRMIGKLRDQSLRPGPILCL